MVLEARTQPLRALPLGNLMRILRLIQYDTMGMLFTGLFIDGDKGQVAVHGQLPGEFIRDLYMDHQAGGAGVDDAAGKPDHGAVAYRCAERHTVDIAADDFAGVAMLAGGGDKGRLDEPRGRPRGKQGAVVIEIFTFD